MCKVYHVELSTLAIFKYHTALTSQCQIELHIFGYTNFAQNHPRFEKVKPKIKTNQEMPIFCGDAIIGLVIVTFKAIFGFYHSKMKICNFDDKLLLKYIHFTFQADMYCTLD